MNNTMELWRRFPVNPLKELNHIQRTVDRLFDDYAGPAGAAKSAFPVAAAFNPSCEVSEDKAAYHFKFDLPGVPKDQIKIELEDNRLTVSGERREQKREEDKDKKTHFSEVAYGSYLRSFTLPTAVDGERIAANYDHGVLSVTVPKTTASRPRQITVK